jgi:hypothetical protein
MLTGKQLRAYLAYTIHGRKPPHQARTAQRNGPPRNDDYRAWIRTLPCLACQVKGRSEAAHTGSDGGMSQKASDYSCVPLCSDCHTLGPGAYHRLGKRTFEQRHGLCCAGIVAQLNREWQARRA